MPCFPGALTVRSPSTAALAPRSRASDDAEVVVEGRPIGVPKFRRDRETEPAFPRVAGGLRLRAADAHTLLEIGAGPGIDAAFFQTEGLTVTAIDLAPEMVTRIKARGVRAQTGDARALNFPPESIVPRK